MNRTVKAAALRLLAWPGLPDTLRKRCMRVAYRLSDVSDLRAGDLRARPEALTRGYIEVHPLARIVLAGSGMSLESGSQTTWTFLWRTPEAVESGLRTVLQRRLEGACHLHKKGQRARRVTSPHPQPRSGLWGRDRAVAVGDVKYKHSSTAEIARADLNQVTTFATGYGVSRAAVVAFGSKSEGEFVEVGEVQVNQFNWNTEELEASAAADQLAVSLLRWLTN